MANNAACVSFGPNHCRISDHLVSGRRSRTRSPTTLAMNSAHSTANDSSVGHLKNIRMNSTDGFGGMVFRAYNSRFWACQTKRKGAVVPAPSWGPTARRACGFSRLNIHASTYFQGLVDTAEDVKYNRVHEVLDIPQSAVEYLSGGKRMNVEILHQLTSLGATLLIVLLVWRYYRRRTFPLAERYSTFGPRFWTGSVDSCVLWPLGFITTVLLSVNIPRIVAAVLVMVESLAWLIYTVVMHARYGQTVGKMVTKVRVVDFRTEGGISWRQAWLREGIPMALSLGFLGWEISLMLTGRLSPGAVASGEVLTVSKRFWLLTALPGLWFVAEVLTMLTNEKRRAIHDFIAGTVVVRTNTEGSIAQPGAAPKGGPPTVFGNSGAIEGPPSVSGASG